MVSAFRQLFQNADLRRRAGRNGRAYIEQNLSRFQTAKEYARLLDSITEHAVASLAPNISGAVEP